MNCKIPDNDIKKAIGNYRNGNKNAYIEIVKLVSLYIYNFPRIIFNQDSDTCGDFYQNIISDLKSIIQGYKISEVRFVTWFTVVLRNRFISFNRSRLREKNVENSPSLVYMDDDTNGFPLYVKIPDEKNYGDYDKLRYDRVIERIVSNLKPRLRVFFHLYFLETIRPEDIVFLSIQLGKNPLEIIKALGLLRNSLDEKYRIKNNLYHRLTNIYNRILESQRKHDSKKVVYYRKIRSRLLMEYSRVKLNPSYECIGNMLDIPPGTVSTGIYRMKKDVKEIIGESNYERL